VSPELERLLALRGIDSQLKLYDDSLNALPRRQRAGEEHLAKAREVLEAHAQRLKELALQRREGEHQAEALAAEELRFESRTTDVKTNEELRALRKEIEDVHGRRSELETRVLEGMESEDEERGKLPGLEKELAEAEAANEAERRSIADERERLGQSREELIRQRDGLLADLRPALRARYERVCKAHRGQAVVSLSKNACGGCLTAQPPQRIQEIRRGDVVVICEFCGRLIVGEDET
jgi:predicted  nucleic acid-binding Zn-ribbon protein